VLSTIKGKIFSLVPKRKKAEKGGYKFRLGKKVQQVAPRGRSWRVTRHKFPLKMTISRPHRKRTEAQKSERRKSRDGGEKGTRGGDRKTQSLGRRGTTNAG